MNEKVFENGVPAVHLHILHDYFELAPENYQKRQLLT